MKCLIKGIIIFSITCLLSCNSVINHKDCTEIKRIDVYSVGYPNITFIIKQTEKDVRLNPQGEIIDKNRLSKIERILNNIPVCPEDQKLVENIVGVCDIYCDGGKKYTILYDGFSVRIDDIVYCDIENLVNELFGKKAQ